jgi:hypothetical protein
MKKSFLVFNMILLLGLGMVNFWGIFITNESNLIPDPIGAMILIQFFSFIIYIVEFFFSYKVIGYR